MSWELLWKCVLISTVAGFALLAVVTTIGGALDCWRLFRVFAQDEQKPAESVDGEQRTQ